MSPIQGGHKLYLIKRYIFFHIVQISPEFIFFTLPHLVYKVTFMTTFYPLGTQRQYFLIISAFIFKYFHFSRQQLLLFYKFKEILFRVKNILIFSISRNKLPVKQAFDKYESFKIKSITEIIINTKEKSTDKNKM